MYACMHVRVPMCASVHACACVCVCAWVLMEYLLKDVPVLDDETS